ncbi:MAG: hypothetical protein EOP07_02285 [Proteobacteria bacterium]|nr:MAG: hypothetical protein EOP07_02285 [Pseudomonadota bacterium]
MKKDPVRRSKTGDDLELLNEIIKDDPWLLEKVLNKIRMIRGVEAGLLDSMAGKTEAPSNKRGK